jgi:hypothetical protein
MQQVPRWEREHRRALRDLNRETIGFAIAHLLEERTLARDDAALCPTDLRRQPAREAAAVSIVTQWHG